MKYLYLLALFSASFASAQSLNKNFTINLVTQDPSMSVVKRDIPDQAPISFNDAAIKHVYDNTIHSVIGSFVYTELNVNQSFHIDNDKWSVDIYMLLNGAGDDPAVMHQDVVVGKKEGSENEFGFMQKPEQFPGVNLAMAQENFASKE